MEYKRVISSERPSTVSPYFTVFDMDGDRYIFCPIRNKCYKINEKPEELVRQWWLYRLRDLYDYDFAQIEVEVSH